MPVEDEAGPNHVRPSLRPGHHGRAGGQVNQRRLNFQFTQPLKRGPEDLTLLVRLIVGELLRTKRSA